MEFCGSCGRPSGQGHEPGCAYRPAAVASAPAAQAAVPASPAVPPGSPAEPGPAPVATAAPAGRPWGQLAVAGGLVLVAAAIATAFLRGPSSVDPSVTAAATTTPTVVTETVLVSSTPLPTPTPTPTPTPSLPIVRSLPSGSWITVIESLPKGEISDSQALAKANELSTGAATLVVVDSSAVPGLTPGYWAVAIVGFATSDQARSACALAGRAIGPTCYSRLVL